MSFTSTLCLESSGSSSSLSSFKSSMRLNRQQQQQQQQQRSPPAAILSERTTSISKLSRALSKLNLRSPGGTVHHEAHAYRVEQAQYLESLYPNTPTNISHVLSRTSIPSGLSKDRVREYIYSIALSSRGTAFLPRYSEIIPGYLYIADSYTGTDPKTLLKLGITHVITIDNKPHFESSSPPSSPLSSPHKNTLHHHIKHHTITPPHPSLALPSSKKAPSYIAIFDEAVDFMDDAFRESKTARVLIHDRLGVDWSPSVAIAWVTRNQRCSYEEACMAVRQRREVVNPSWEVQKGVKEWMGLEHARSFFPLGRGGRYYLSQESSSSSSPTSASSRSSASSTTSNSDSEDTFEDVIDIR